MKLPELSVCTSNIEASRFALIYGADSVYLNAKILLSHQDFQNIEDDLTKLINFAHSLSKKIYLDISDYFTNSDIRFLSDLLKDILEINLDGIILSNIGVLKLAKILCPKIPIVISNKFFSQNFLDISFFEEQNVKRVIFPVYLTLEELREIRAKTDIEFDVMVHGPICIANFSGCFLTNVLHSGDSLFGNCNFECRKKYYLVEEKDGKEYYSVHQQDRQTHIFNSKDLCMIEFIPQLVETGIQSFRIDGSLKSLYYISIASRVYKNALYLFSSSNRWKVDSKWYSELQSITNQGYTTFFYFGTPDVNSINYDLWREKNKNTFEFVGIVEYYDALKKMAVIELKNTIRRGDIVEFITPDFFDFKQRVNFIKDGSKEIKFLPAIDRKIAMGVEYPVKPYDIVRRKIV